MSKPRLHRQQQFLDAMGIDVWLRRDLTAPLEESGEVLPNSDREADIRAASWEALHRLVAECRACPLHTSRTKTVFGSGDAHASLLLVGEAPGAAEDAQGLPFVGPAGKLLTEMLLAIGLTREQVFIANTLKCRPPNNRDPLEDEVRQCKAFLQRQVELIKPRLILALGRVAAHNILSTRESLARLRLSVARYENTEIPVYVTYHPAYLLRSPTEKYKAWEDLKKVRHFLVSSP